MIEVFMSIFVLLLAWVSYRVGAGDWSLFRNQQPPERTADDIPVAPTTPCEDPSTVATWATTAAD